MSREAFDQIMSDAGPRPAAPESPDKGVQKDKPSLSGQLGALWREGLKDVQNVVLNAFPDSIQGVVEPGTPLNPTQQMVTDAVVKGPQPVQGKDSSLQDILDAPSQPTPPSQQQDRDMGREM
jgi:hypothetical protein